MVKTWAAHGWKQRPREQPARTPEWLLIEWPKGAAQPCDYWMLWRPSTDEAPSLRSAVHAATGRWKIEQDYRELKDELGLDHFEGRGWLGWHHHVTLVSLAFGFLRSEQARAKKNYQLRGEFHGGRVDKRWLSLPALTILLRQQS